MKLPEEFCRIMSSYLGTEYEDFQASYQLPRHYGLRINTLKISVSDFLKISPFDLQSVPWTGSGFYLKEEDKPAKHPYYHAGLYYIQEPSAMVPAEILGIEPGDRVLDLCAAPGGKSTHAAAFLKGEGVLVSNDISADRTKSLVRNLELFGVKNSVITNETPERLVRNFSRYFDKIIIDAPCSGEGMFRKDPDLVRQWGIYSSKKCNVLQRDILFYAAQMLRRGGRMVYSTCTFSPQENEEIINEFLKKNSDFFLVDIPKEHGFAAGRPEWGQNEPELSKTVRLWPHRVKGEGHFVAVLQKTGEEDIKVEEDVNTREASEKELEDFRLFVDENLNRRFKGQYILFGEHLYLRPSGIPNLNGIKLIRPGWYLGMLKKNRFVPSHSMALALKKGAFKKVLDFPSTSKNLSGYLKGETLFLDQDKGWTIVCVDGFPVGWGKQVGSILKNHYPKGWRLIK